MRKDNYSHTHGVQPKARASLSSDLIFKHGSFAGSRSYHEVHNDPKQVYGYSNVSQIKTNAPYFPQIKRGDDPVILK